MASSSSYPLELLGAHANGRFGLRRQTALSLSATGIHYNDRDARRDDFEYVNIDPMDPLCIHVKFHGRPKAKQFFFKQREQCEVALQAIHDWGDPFTVEGLRIEGTASSYAGSSAAFEDDLKELDEPEGPERVAAAQHSAYRHHRQSPAGSRRQLFREGWACWCCRVHAAEATLFGVLLPITVLIATLFQILRELDAHGGAWLSAPCQLHARFFEAERRFHHGRYARAKERAWESGYYWEIRPAWNCTVVHNATTRWAAVLHEAVLDSEGPSCLGAVGDPMLEAKAACSADDSWVVPALPLHEAVPSFYRAPRDPTVFRTVREPAIFFVHFAVMGACFVTALGVGAALLRVWCFEAQGDSRATGLSALAAKLDMSISSQGLLGHLHADAADSPWKLNLKRHISWAGLPQQARHERRGSFGAPPQQRCASIAEDGRQRRHSAPHLSYGPTPHAAARGAPAQSHHVPGSIRSSDRSTGRGGTSAGAHVDFTVVPGDVRACTNTVRDML